MWGYIQDMFKFVGFLRRLGFLVSLSLLFVKPATGWAWLIVLTPLRLAWWALSLLFDPDTR